MKALILTHCWPTLFYSPFLIFSHLEVLYEMFPCVFVFPHSYWLVPVHNWFCHLFHLFFSPGYVCDIFFSFIQWQQQGKHCPITVFCGIMQRIKCLCRLLSINFSTPMGDVLSIMSGCLSFPISSSKRSQVPFLLLGWLGHPNMSKITDFHYKMKVH